MAERYIDPNCSDCKGTGQYVGLWLDVGPCLSCKRPKPETTPEPVSEHRCARAARALTPTSVVEKEEAEVRVNIDLKDTWKKLFQSP